MKLTTDLIVLVSVLSVTSCRFLGDYKSDKQVSPTKKYYIVATVNRTDHGKKDFASVVVHLYDSKGHLLSEVDTRAGDANKWAAGWDKLRDTIILFSTDIANQAYKIENGEMRPVYLTDEINTRADELKQEKYRE